MLPDRLLSVKMCVHFCENLRDLLRQGSLNLWLVLQVDKHSVSSRSQRSHTLTMDFTVTSNQHVQTFWSGTWFLLTNHRIINYWIIIFFPGRDISELPLLIKQMFCFKVQSQMFWTFHLFIPRSDSTAGNRSEESPLSTGFINWAKTTWIIIGLQSIHHPEWTAQLADRPRGLITPQETPTLLNKNPTSSDTCSSTSIQR